MLTPHLLLFGGRGAIGGAVLKRFSELGWQITATSRSAVMPGEEAGVRWIVCDPSAETIAPEVLDAARYDAVCWAQGANLTDSVFTVQADKHLALYQANCVFVLETLKLLLNRDLLAPKARLVVISSIWQNIARQDKLSYIMTKAAIGGLVRSASVDLAAHDILINAVLPSAIDTPMTRANLATEQISRLAQATRFDRLVCLDDVVAAITFLLSPVNTGMTGQCLTVDLGFSHAHLV